jgi:hypothetical protein
MDDMKKYLEVQKREKLAKDAQARNHIIPAWG